MEKRDDFGNLTYYKDSKGFEYWYEYDANNRIVHYKDSTGYEYWKDYYPNGDIVTTERGRVKD